MIDTTPLRKKTPRPRHHWETRQEARGNGRQSVLKISVIFAVGLPQG